MKCHFDYNPYNDNLIPCKEAGLKFSKGEILQIVNREDPNWWQVRARKATSLESCFTFGTNLVFLEMFRSYIAVTSF